MIKKEDVYATEFEKAVLAEVERQMNGLPGGLADCYIGPPRGEIRSVAATFEIEPTNPAAARIGGAVIQGEGAVVSVGHSRRELWFRQTNASGAAECAARLSQICRAVFAGHFAESLRVDRTGRRIS